MGIEFKVGNVIDEMQEHDVMLHIANCQRVMGGGFARQVRDRLPLLYMADLATGLGDGRKLGTFSTATIDGVICLNVYGQFRYGREKTQLNLKALDRALKAINILYAGLSICMPKIGSLAAGGDWARIEQIIKIRLKDCNVTIYTL